MILKASQRGGGKQLGLHLMRMDDNEHMEVHEVRGFISDDVVGALKEAYAISRGTHCKQFLFSVSLNPPETENVSVDTFENAIDLIEQKNGLTGQPRVVVFHEKEGRRHCHAVWSRIDANSMTAKNLPHFKLKLRDISRELYMENGWKMPRGLMNSAERDPRNYTLAEYQQAKRMGENARDLKSMMQECWAVSDSRTAFTQALKERGMTLARGDRRGHVAVTHEGTVLSIARYVSKRTKEVRAKLGDPDTLPSVDEAKTEIARDMSLTFKRHVQEARFNKERAMVPLEARRYAMTREHRQERAKSDEAQKERRTKETRARSERFNKGIRGLWDRITGEHSRLKKQNKQETIAGLQRDRDKRQAMIAEQMKQRWALQVQIRETRQRHAGLFKRLRQDRDHYREMSPSPRSELKSSFERIKDMRKIEMAKPSKEPVREPAERLKKLREGRTARPIQRDRRPEPER